MMLTELEENWVGIRALAPINRKLGNIFYKYKLPIKHDKGHANKISFVWH